MDFIKLCLTALLSVGALFVIAKIMGHKQLAQMDFYDYIAGITIGSIAAELATELEEPWQPLVAMVVYGAVSVILNLITHRIPRLRKYINGTPTIIYNDGKLYRENLKKAKLDLSEFMLLLRENGYFDLEDIKCAIFEQNGKLSVLPKSEKRPADPSDLGLKPKEAHIKTEIIMDGRIMGENLKRRGLDVAWLESVLKSKGVSNAREVFLAVADEDNELTLYFAE